MGWFYCGAVVNALGGVDIICAQFLIFAWGAAAVAATAALVVLYRRRGIMRTLLHSAITLVVVTVAAAATVNAHYAYLPTAGDVVDTITSNRQWLPYTKLTHLSKAQLRRAEQRGVIIREPLSPDPANGFTATTSIVYLPRQYFLDPTERFPVVYLFHGSPGEPADWMHAGQAQQAGATVAAQGRPVIMVAPRMSRAWTDDRNASTAPEKKSKLTC